jgi:exonuclease III
LFVILACNKRINNDTGELPPEDRINIPAFGTDSTLEIATWNIQQFPKSASQTVESSFEIIQDLDIDLYAVEEITDLNSFNALVNSLTDYSGIVGTGASSFALWPGIIYKNSVITVSNQQFLFTTDSYNFPRAPYSVYVEYSDGGNIFNFTLIVLHLKASSGGNESENIQRRRDAIIKLEQYIADKLQQGGDPDYILAGDWNDKLDDISDNVFLPFINEQPQTYLFLTWPFRGSTTEYSYIGGSFRSLIDHLMITISMDLQYSHTTQILKIDQYFNQYINEVSDHRPVAARFSDF